MHTSPNRTVTQHTTAPGITAQKPSAASLIEGRMPLTGGAISYTKAGNRPAVLLIHGLGGTRPTWRDLIPGRATRRLFGVLPALIGHCDARVLAAVLRGLTDDHQRRAFLREARTVIDWHGQTVSASRQLGQLSEVPPLVAWGVDDKTTAPTRLLSALQTFRAATRPFLYVEDRWVRLLTSADPAGEGEARNPAARSVPGHASSSDYVVRH
jgi:hypothetical protein